MASFLSADPQLLARPHFASRPTPPSPAVLLPLRSQGWELFAGGRCASPALLRRSFATRAGPSPHLPYFQVPEGLARDLFARMEGLIFTVADAALSSSDVTAESSKQSGDWLTGITNYLEAVLKVLKDGLSSLHVPYPYGFAIILLTVLVKAATFPLTKKQVESALAMRALQPQVKAIQKRYAGDQERIQLETARLYKLAGVNPLAGCLPTLLTIPVWIGLYRALSNVANEGLLTERFFWIPSLAGPTTISSRQSGSGISWLFPFVDGHPPLGWSDTIAYLVLPVLLVISQYISTHIMQPSQLGIGIDAVDILSGTPSCEFYKGFAVGNDPSQQNAQAATKFLPLLIGYFALSVPSGLSLYWLTNNILSTAQQIWLQKLGGAKNPVQDYISRTSREETSNKQKTMSTMQNVSEVESEPSQPSQGKENEVKSGPRPGERFRQIKEEEARRRKQREEEKKRMQEATQDSRLMIRQQNLESSDRLADSTGEQVSKKEIDTQLSTTENGGLNLKTTTTNKDDLGLGNVKKEQSTSLTGDGTAQNSLDEGDDSSERY